MPMSRFLVAKCAVAMAAIALPAGAVGAGADDSEPDDTTGGGDGSAEPPVDIEFQIDMMLGLVPEEEMNQYYEEQGRERELAIQACMNEAGFEYNPENTADAMSFDPYNGMSQLEWAQQWGFGMWTTMDPENNPYSEGSDEFVWANEEIVSNLSEAEQNAWFEVNNRCSQEAWTEDDPWSNPMVQQAMEDFNTRVDNDPRIREALETWVDCMAEAGHPFPSREAMYEAVYGDMDDEATWQLQEQFYESEAWEPTSPDHAEWQALVDEEIEIAVADATCSPPYDQVREVVAADLRPELVAVWQTIDWSLPPVTYPEPEIIGPEGEVIDEAPDDTAGQPDTTDGGGLDLGDPIDTSIPDPTQP
jgi:hypothetical protein